MKLNDKRKKMYEDEIMSESERIHFGTYHGKVMYRFINDNDLWDLEYGYLSDPNDDKIS